MLENHSFDNIFCDVRHSRHQRGNCSRLEFLCWRKVLGAGWCPLSMTTDPGHEFKDVLEQLCGAEAACEYKRGTYPSVNNSGFVSSYATSLSEDTGTPTAAHIGDIMACFRPANNCP